MTGELKSLNEFLSRAQQRMVTQPGRIPFDSKTGNLVIDWLRTLAPRFAAGEDLSE